MPDNFSITIDASQVSAMLKRAKADIDSFIVDVTGELALEAKAAEQEMIPVKTGVLRRSLDIFGNAKKGYRVLPTARRKGVPYAIFVARDTREHPIPKPGNTSAKVLHWTDGGKDMFAKSVMHPGTTGTPFDIMAFEEIKLKAGPIMEKIADQHIARWN